MEKEKNMATIQQIYANVGSKNLNGVLDALTEDIIWAPPFTAEIPHTKLRIGKGEVKDFVIEMAGEVTYTEFIPQEFYADQDTVIVKGFFKGTANHTGKAFESDWIHLWKFRADKISSYQAFWNTQRVALAIH